VRLFAVCCFLTFSKKVFPLYSLGIAGVAWCIGAFDFDLGTVLRSDGNSAGFSKLNMNKKTIAETNAELFTDETAAQFIGGIEPRTVRDWRMRRGLGFLRITPKVIRIRRVDLEKFLARHAVSITRGQA